MKHDVIILDEAPFAASTSGEPLRVLVIEGSSEHVRLRVAEALRDLPLVIEERPLKPPELYEPRLVFDVDPRPRSNARVPEFLQHSPFRRRSRR